MDIKKAYEITDAKIQFVSLVDRAANLKKFLITKADAGQAAFTTYGRIIKTDTDSHYVTGIVYEPLVADAHDNYMTAEEITKAAYNFAKNGNKVDLQHSFEPLKGAAVVESWIAKADYKIGDEDIKAGTWLMTVEVSDDEIWDAIEKGEITGFSMGGFGVYSEEDVQLEDINKQEQAEKKGLLKKLAGMFGLDVIEKGQMKESYEERIKARNFWAAFHSLEDTLMRYDYYSDTETFESDPEKIQEALSEFNTILTDILSGGTAITKAIIAERPIEKAGKKISTVNRETLQGVYDTLGILLEALSDKKPEDENPEDNPDDDNGGETEESNNNTSEESEESETDKNKKTNKEETEVTKQETEQIEKIVSEAITKAMEANNPQKNTPTPSESVAKGLDGQKDGGEKITQETVSKWVEEAITKALSPKEEPVTAEMIQQTINQSVAKAMEPILQSRGLSSNLNNEGSTGGGEEVHYLHGII